MIREVANRYTIISLIGQGGMADVYKAFDTILNRVVAIKILRSKVADDPMTLVRFQREASAASKLHHANIIDIYDVGEWEDLHYIVMEFVRGRTLKQLVQQRGALSYEEAISIMKQLTSAVSHAHENNIIHRDIKPQNVLIKDDGTVKITDFGIAIANDSVQLTSNNAVMGSAHYLAPESTQGKEPTVQVDIYSLGIVFYELLTGDIPFKGKTPTEIAVRHLRDKLPYVCSFNPDIPQSVENIVIKAAAKLPEERYQSAAEMVYDLNHCLDPEYRNMPRLKLKTERLDMQGEAEKEKPKREVHSHHGFTFKGALMGILAGVVLILLLLFGGAVTGLLRFSGFLGYETMPNVVGMTAEQGEAALEDANFSLAHVTFAKDISDSYDAGTIMKQSVKAGSVVPGDSSIELTLSKGPSYLVPDYTGRYLDTVQAELEQQGVNLNVKISYQGEPNTNPGIILSQTGLEPGDRIDPDAGETIYLTVAEYPSLTLPATLIGMNVDEAKTYLNGQGIAVIGVDTGSGGDTVLYTDPAVGTEYTQEGTDSVVTLYY